MYLYINIHIIYLYIRTCICIDVVLAYNYKILSIGTDGIRVFVWVHMVAALLFPAAPFRGPRHAFAEINTGRLGGQSSPQQNPQDGSYLFIPAIYCGTCRWQPKIGRLTCSNGI